MASRRTSRRSQLRALLAGTAAAVLAMTGAVSAAADEEAPTTTITGTVTREADGTPVSSIGIFVNNADFTQNGVASTDANGDYTVSGLAPGQYTVRFATEGSGTGLIGEYWDGARTTDTAQRVIAVGGETVDGIDATLQQGATVTGRVTKESDGSRVSGAGVYLSPNSLGAPPRFAMTDADGVYRAEGLVPATYTVRFDAQDVALVDEYWAGAYDQRSATPIPLVAGQVAAGIDASLVGGAVISGQVTAASDGSAVAGVVSFSGGGQFVSAQIESDGSYSANVAPGTYLVQFVSYDARAFSEYWENARTEAEATLVTVTGGESQVLNAQLETGRAITGVVRVDGEPLYDAIVEVFRNGMFAGTMAHTNQNGEYELILPPGEYSVRVHGTSYDPTYAWQYFDRADTASEATTVSLGAASDRTGIDFDLSKGGSILGAISGGGAELQGEGAAVTAYLWSGSEWNVVATEYTVDGFALGSNRDFPTENGGLLPAGTYTIGVQAEGFCTQFLGGGSTLNDAESVDVIGGEVVNDIAITLTTDCENPEPKPTLSLGAASVRAGADVAVSGTGFAPGETIAFELRSDPIALGTLTADAQGSLQGSFRIPASAPVGAHTLVALNAQSTIVASAALQVTAASGQGTSGQGASGQGTSGSATGGRLANTGSEMPFAAMLAAFTLVTLGVLLVRRRRIES